MYKKALIFLFFLHFTFYNDKTSINLQHILFQKENIKNYDRVYRDMGALIICHQAELKQNQLEIDRVKSNMKTVQDLVKEEIEES